VSPERISSAELADEASVPYEYVERLVAAGVLHPDDEGRHRREDVLQIRLLQALSEAGVGFDDVVWAVHEQGLPVDRVAEMWTLDEPSGRTFGEFVASLGDRGELLPSIYAALGLAAPPPETLTRRDEEAALASFLDVWQIVDDRPEVYLRAARIAGEGIRRIQLATTDLFDELDGPPPSQIRKGRSPDDAMRPSVLLSAAMAQLLPWLHARHTEHEVVERVVAGVQRALARAGRTERSHPEPRAVAFVDLAGYTRLAATEGDEQAAEAATLLHSLALEAARPHNGRVVKLLGDGVVLTYPSTRPAVASVADLMGEIPGAGLPPAHAGIAAGPIVSRDGDIYGHTVNLASRISGHAAPGELLVLADQVGAVTEAGRDWEDAGEASLKGVPDPVRLVRVRLEAPTGIAE
jgi:adenylate cyclase